jgi:hypothetical protein
LKHAANLRERERKKKMMTDAPQPLNQSLTKRLIAYAAMAGATVAASTPHANAEVVYTPAHAKVNLDFYLDLNHDGILDFHIHSSYFSGLGQLVAIPESTGNRVAGVRQDCSFNSVAAAALHSGAIIGHGLPFPEKAQCLVGFLGSYSSGPWVHKKERYLGFMFMIQGKEHFGWARMSVTNIFCFECAGRVLGYAYETVAGKPIIAGDEGKTSKAAQVPATLGALTLGTHALNSWRIEEEKK